MGKAPAFQFYPNDWMMDTRMLSLSARGAWIDLLGAMWHSQTRGMLSLTWTGYARLLGVTVEQARAAIGELIDMQICDHETEKAFHVTQNETEKAFHVTDCNAHVTLICRRMYREHKVNENSTNRVRKYRMKRKCNGNVTPPSSSSSSVTTKTNPPTPLAGGDAASGECVEDVNPKTTEEKERLREEFALAVQVSNDCVQAHPPGTVRETRAMIEHAYYVITKLREEGKSLKELKTAHEFALSDIREATAGGWTGWRARYMNPWNWLKISSSGVRWIDIWIAAGASGGRGDAGTRRKKICRGCGVDVEKLNFEMLCPGCQAKEAAEIEKMRRDPAAQKRAKQAMSGIWEALGKYEKK